MSDLVGGPIGARKPYLVGDKGPEFIVPVCPFCHQLTWGTHPCPAPPGMSERSGPRPDVIDTDEWARLLVGLANADAPISTYLRLRCHDAALRASRESFSDALIRIYHITEDTEPDARTPEDMVDKIAEVALAALRGEPPPPVAPAAPEPDDGEADE